MRKRRLRPYVAAFSAFLALAGVVAFGFGTPAHAWVTPRVKPPAPGPQFASRADLERLEAIQRSILRRDWTTARNGANAVEDPIAASLAQWMYFDAEDPGATPTAIDAFLDAHPDWPSQTKIQIHGEKRMSRNAPASEVLAFFDTRDPITGAGHLHLARALLGTGEREAAEAHIRSAWVHNDFDLQDEQYLLANYGAWLTPDDHAARVDRLLWGRQVTAARRVFSRLPGSERRKAEARAALLIGAANGPALFNSLPSDERSDPGVLHAAIRYYRRAGSEPRAVEIARQTPSDPEIARNPSRFWEEMQLLMRWGLTGKRYADAYAMAAGHSLPPDTTDFAEAEFDAGWIALRFLDAPERAAVHFAALTKSVATPISLSRGYYWQARAAEAMGDEPAATAFYRKAAEYFYSFYGQLAAEKLGGAYAEARFAPETAPSPADKARFSSRPVVAALRILSEMDNDRAFLIFAYHADDELETPGEYVQLGRLVEAQGATHLAVRAGKAGIRRNAFAAEVAYPVIFIPNEASRFAPPEIILGLSRQESEFNPRAFSRAGARGLMQLIPSTAEITARKEGLRYSRTALLDDPVYNMTIGSAHLSHLFAKFDGSLIMTFAAYNAGAGRVSQWIERYGDPRSPLVDPIDWVEQIPFEETRNYVQRVLENTQVYRGRLNDTPIPGRLSKDLEIGGPAGRTANRPSAPYAGDLAPISNRIVAYAESAMTPPADPQAAPASDAPTAETEPATLEQPAPTARSRRKSSAQQPAGGSAAASADKIEMQAPAPALAPEPAPARATATSATPVVDVITPDVRAGEPPSPADASAASLNAAGAVRTVAPTLVSSEPDISPEECDTYVAFIAAADPDDVSADDLNAGARAELIGGGAACGGDVLDPTRDQ